MPSTTDAMILSAYAITNTPPLAHTATMIDSDPSNGYHEIKCAFDTNMTTLSHTTQNTDFCITTVQAGGHTQLAPAKTCVETRNIEMRRSTLQ